MPVVMGRNTYESLKKELPGRINIVVTKKRDFHPANIFVTHSIEDALDKAKETESKEIFIIGGGDIFKQTMDKVDRIYLTRVHTTIEGDTTYPEIDLLKWKKTNEQSFPADQKNNYPYTFEVWEKMEKI
jgi:dihydrofolate reductase